MVIQQNSRKLLMMNILISETCWAHTKWNKIASGIKMVFYSSTKIQLRVPITQRFATWRSTSFTQDSTPLGQKAIHINCTVLHLCFKTRWIRYFSLIQCVKTGSETHPSSYKTGTGRYFSGGNAGGWWSWLNYLNLVPKNGWNYTSAPPYAFMAWRGREEGQLYHLCSIYFQDLRQTMKTSSRVPDFET